MTWFLKDRDPDALPPLEGRIPGALSQFALNVQDYWLKSNTYYRHQRLRSEMVAEMEGALDLRPEYIPSRTGQGLRYDRSELAVTPGSDAHIAVLTARMAKARTSGAPFGVLPASPEEFMAEYDRRLTRERLDIEEVEARGDSTLARVGGQIAGAVADPINVVAGLLGGAPVAGALGKFILKEAALGAAAEVPGALQRRTGAEHMGLPTPTLSETGQDIALGGIGGAALAGLAAAGVKAWQLFGQRKAAEDVVTPPGVRALEHQAEVDRLERELRLGTEPTLPQPLKPDVNLVAHEDPAVQNVLRMIRQIEAPGGYDQVYSGIAGTDLPPKPLTQMTISEVLAWQDNIDPRYQSEAAGAYQIMEDTLRGLVSREGLTGAELFDGAMQDRLAVALMRDAGLEDWRAGLIGPEEFNDGLAGIWAAVPLSRGPNAGQSRYGGDGLNAAQTSVDDMLAVIGGERAPDRGNAVTSRGYTRSGQVRVGDWGRVDVEYEVVDASLLRPATGRFQPRDRAQVNSDAWVAATAADLDPSQLMPSPNAAHGAPLVGPDNMIESGNGRFQALLRAYDLHPDRSAAYRAEIENVTRMPIPDGIDRPVLIARRKTELTDNARESLAVAAQDSGVAELTPIETARVGARQVTPDRLSHLDPTKPLGDPANKGFVMKLAEALPKGVRNAIFTDGALNDYGEDLLSSAIFARAWPDADILSMLVSRRAGREMRNLLDALEDAAPAWAAMRAEIAAGSVRQEFDITGHVLEAMRILAAARRTAASENRPMASVLDEILNQEDIAGPLSDLTRALVEKFWPNGRIAPRERIVDFLKTYAAEAMQAGRAGGMFGEISPAEVLRRMDGAVFGGLADDYGQPRAVVTRGLPSTSDAEPTFSLSGIEDTPYAESVAVPERARAIDAATDNVLRESEQGPFGPRLHYDSQDPNAWKQAIKDLQKLRAGEAVGILKHKDIKDPIDLVWGEEGTGRSNGWGLAKIAKYHPEVLDDLQARLSSASKVSESPNRIRLESDRDQFAIRLDYDAQDKTWLLTAFEKQPAIGRSTERPGAAAEGSSPSDRLRPEDNAAAPKTQPAGRPAARDPIADDIESLISEFRPFVDQVISAPDGNSTLFDVRAVLDDLTENRELIDLMEVCRMKGRPQ